MKANEIRLKVDGKQIYREIKFTISYDGIYLYAVLMDNDLALLKAGNEYQLSINDYSLGYWFLSNVSKIDEEYISYVEYQFIETD